MLLVSDTLPGCKNIFFPNVLLVCNNLPGCKDIFSPILLLVCNDHPVLNCYDWT